MKLFCIAPPTAQEAIALLADELAITLVPEKEAELTLTVEGTEETIVDLTLRGTCATLIYGGGTARLCRGLACLSRLWRDGITEERITEHPLFTMNGTMMDASRNAVPTVESVKRLLRHLALMGQNTLMLYTEDTYEIKERPYFGYMRGRYTEKELREIDGYAATLGIEVIPCIQTLGHLATALRWGATRSYKDTERVLMVGAEETYALIDDMIRTMSVALRSRRIHIGMDETHDLGLGAYLKKHGYRTQKELYLEHLARVVGIAERYGYRPMMWSDMFFRIFTPEGDGFSDYDLRVELPKNAAELVPPGVQQVFWDYYHTDGEFYRQNLIKHRLLGKDTVFAGGVWLWSGHSPLFSRSLANTLPALDACRDTGTREILATVWHNGSEAALPLSLAGIAWYADYDYRGYYSEEGVRNTFRAATGEAYDDFLKAELPEYPHGGRGPLSRALLYNDPLCGLADKTVAKAEGYREYYDGCAVALADTVRDGYFAPAFDTQRALVAVLRGKADFGVRLRRAYLDDDRDALAALGEECLLLKRSIDDLRRIHRRAWMGYYKPFGWEVHDLRYGALMARFETAAERIRAYLDGEIDAIPELLEERLRYECIGENAPISEGFLWYSYPGYPTAGIL